ncbi:MAG: hypothetical protein ACRBB6_14250 [Neptuniibacter sp.]
MVDSLEKNQNSRIPRNQAAGSDNRVPCRLNAAFPRVGLKPTPWCVPPQKRKVLEQPEISVKTHGLSTLLENGSSGKISSEWMIPGSIYFQSMGLVEQQVQLMWLCWLNAVYGVKVKGA